MMSSRISPLEFPTRASWRRWLKHNHDQATEAWLVIRKKSANADCISLDEAVQEALCFGWIDGQLQTRDGSTYALRFSPRKPVSVWSVHNIRRVEQLIANGQMTEAGLKKVHQGKESGQWDAATRREQVDIVPPELEDALRQRVGCLDAYRNLSASRKQQLIYWLESAKRPETRERRIMAIIKQLET
jgi:uncharacterized protein YdeI (YjbR/CyaY-like superfamily)